MLFILYARTPFWMNIVVGPIISYLSIVMNIIVFVALFHKKIMSPSTVLMQGLALADGLTAFFTYGFEPFFNMHYEVIGSDTFSIDDRNHSYNFDAINDAYIFDAINDTYYDVIYDTYIYDVIYDTYIYDDTNDTYKNFDAIKDIIKGIDELTRLVVLKFPYCLMHYCLTNLGDTFHLVSILLTASLGLQKLLAVACPIWSKIHINEQKSCVVCCTCLLFTLTVNVPKLFVIRFSRGKEGDVCLISEPQHTIQKYILVFYPIMFSVILVGAVVTMVISTCYITFTLCRRKRVRGHAVASRAEIKSCVLIVCVMMVFLLAEVPRLYVSSTIFSTYRSNVDKQNVALQKLSTEAKQRSLTLLEARWSLLKKESCFSDFNELPSRDKRKYTNQTEIEKNLEEFSEYLKYWVHHVFKDLFQQIYYEYIKDDILRIISVLTEQKLKVSQQDINEYAIIKYCKQSNNTNWKNIFQSTHGFDHDIFKISSAELVSSPYSEPMNYLLNIIWGRIEINLEHLKLLIEILKTSMIIGCASNFLIYIVMSEKLRDALKMTFRCREHKTMRVDATDMKIRG